MTRLGDAIDIAYDWLWRSRIQYPIFAIAIASWVLLGLYLAGMKWTDGLENNSGLGIVITVWDAFVVIACTRRWRQRRKFRRSLTATHASADTK